MKKKLMPEQGQGYAQPENSHNGIKSFDFTGSDGALLATVRAVVIDSVPWFIAADVAQALEYSQVQALTKLVDEEDKNTAFIQNGCTKVNQSVINARNIVQRRHIAPLKPAGQNVRCRSTGSHDMEVLA